MFHTEYMANIRTRLPEVDHRLEDMDRYGIEVMVLSLTNPGVQGIPEPQQAVDTARRLNDRLAEVVSQHPNRFAAFAAVPLQDPPAAANELERAITQSGFKGALINGFSNVGDAET